MAAPAAATAVLRTAAAAGAQVAGGDAKTGLKAAIAALLALLALIMLLVAPLFLIYAHIEKEAAEQQGIDSAGIPAAAQPFVAMYQDAAKVYGVNPFLLMAVHEDETTYGTLAAPGVKTGINSAGCCAGPMQFSISGGPSPGVGGQGGTWGTYARAHTRAKLERPADYPLRFDRHPNVYDSYDSIYAAAAYFKDLGAGPELDAKTFAALTSYKGVPPFSIPFARHDYQRAKELQAAAATPTLAGGPLTLIPGQKVRVLPNGLAAAPRNAPRKVKGIVRAANQISNRPYLLVHYPTHINNPTYDCSSSTTHALWGGGLFGRAPTTSENLMSYGKPGPGRWVSIYAHSGHVFLIVGGARFDTSGGYDSGPNAGESGPRWRTGPRAMDGFVVRHPPGL